MKKGAGQGRDALSFSVRYRNGVQCCVCVAVARCFPLLARVLLASARLAPGPDPAPQTRARCRQHRGHHVAGDKVVRRRDREPVVVARDHLAQPGAALLVHGAVRQHTKGAKLRPFCDAPVRVLAALLLIAHLGAVDGVVHCLRLLVRHDAAVAVAALAAARVHRRVRDRHVGDGLCAEARDEQVGPPLAHLVEVRLRRAVEAAQAQPQRKLAVRPRRGAAGAACRAAWCTCARASWRRPRRRRTFGRRAARAPATAPARRCKMPRRPCTPAGPSRPCPHPPPRWRSRPERSAP
ncbi:hypothetical protein ERJ75_001300400 [Trypanosoma vivax]|nr:hypothetical protein ERJ75_001300400 [Trypanosoma vivax]